MPRPIIIILEDDPVFLRQHTERLHGAGYECWPTQDCNKAVLWACENPDIRMVLVDEILLEVGDVPNDARENQRVPGSGVIREINLCRNNVEFIYITAYPKFFSATEKFIEEELKLKAQLGVKELFHRHEFENNSERAYQKLIKLLEQDNSNPMQPIVDSISIAERSRGVCQIKLIRFFNGLPKDKPAKGTGWLITPELILTCWHTISPSPSIFDDAISETDLAQQISTITADFSYLTENYAPQEHSVNLICHDKDLDYALLQIKACKDGSRSMIPIELTNLEINQLDTVLLQHSQGGGKKSALGWYVQKFDKNSTKILHKIESGPGSSGGPLLNQSGYKAFAMHVGLERYFYNNLPAAVLLKYIIDDIKLKSPNFYSNIAHHQNL
jgi:hypothetical protein